MFKIFQLIAVSTFLGFLTVGSTSAQAYSEEDLLRPVLTKNERKVTKVEKRWQDEVADKVSDMTNNIVSTDGTGMVDVYTADDAKELNEISPASGGPDGGVPPIQYGRLAGLGVDVGKIHIAAGYSTGSDDPSTFDDGQGIVIGAGFRHSGWQYSSTYIHGAEDKIGFDRGDANKVSMSARHDFNRDSALTLSLQASDFTSSSDDDVRMTLGFTKKLEIHR